MSLFEFLVQHKSDILSLSERKTVELAALRPSSEELQKGLPLFYDQLIAILQKNKAIVSLGDEKDILHIAGEHGKEMLRLGYTLTHVVHAYGAICQAITQVASTSKASVTALEFHNLNRCLDIAIAGAVTEFEAEKNIETKAREVEHLGSFAHELRNALNRAMIASEMMVKGVVGASGSTAKVLQYSLSEMNLLLERSLSEIKLRAKSEVHNEVFSIIEVINQLIITAEIEAGARKQSLVLQVDTKLEVETDRQLVLAALGNIIQNALKFSHANGTIKIIARAEDNKAIIEVQDECGGISSEKMEEIFRPYSQINENKVGVGLGLTISRKAMEHCGGQLTAHNVEGGCVFRITLQRYTALPKVPAKVV